MSSTLSSNTLRMAVAALERLGHDPAPILAACQIQRRTLENTWARIPIAKELKFWPLVVEQTGIPQIALQMAEAVPFGTFPLLEYVGASCHSPLQALHLLARYAKVVYGGWDPELEEGPNQIEFRLGASSDPEECRHSTDFALAVLCERLQRHAAVKIPILGAMFRHSLVGPIETYQKRFGPLVFFEQPEDMLVYGPEIRTIPCLNSNPLALGSLLHGVNAMFARVTGQGSTPGSDLAQSIKAALSELPAGEVVADQIAKRLGMSKRTLQRRLETEGRSLRAIVSEARREQATQLLEDTDLPVEEIGLRVGYSDLKSFNRAFQAWYKMSPSAFRRAQGR